jgi:hypothetical protein
MLGKHSARLAHVIRSISVVDAELDARQWVLNFVSQLYEQSLILVIRRFMKFSLVLQYEGARVYSVLILREPKLPSYKV